MPLMGRKTLLKENLELWLNDRLLRQGLYTNVQAGDSDFYSNNISRLVSTADEDYVNNQVWQSPFKNWVHESGIPSSESGVLSPAVASGVYINGTFYSESTTTGTYQHFIDFRNGRVVFSTPLNGNETVEASFSYKHVFVDFADKYDNENMPLYIEMSYKDNPALTGVDIYPSKESRSLPAIFIDVIGSENAGYELGSKSLITDFNVVFHTWARDSYYLDLIEDILRESQQEVVFGINFNTAPFPLLARGRRNPLFGLYSDMAAQWSPYFWRRIYIEETKPKKEQSLFEVERAMVNARIRIYPNF